MTIALVHGAFHGSWQWGPLIAELDRRDQFATAVDLPVDDPVADVLAYAERCVEAFRDYDDLLVVGHSLAGLVLPFIAERLPVKRLVFLAAALHGEFFGVDIAQMLSLPADAHEVTDSGCVRLAPRTAETYFYNDVPISLRRWAVSMLRDQGTNVYPTRLPAPTLTPDMTFIVCRNDLVVDPVWARATALAISGTPALELDSGHSPFLSRPAELADILTGLATR